MTAPKGGFYSAEDADSRDPDHSEHVSEGAYYTWRAREISALLGEEMATLVLKRFGIRDGGNVDADPHGEFHGRNILFVEKSFADLTDGSDRGAADVRAIVASARKRLFDHRTSRPRPHLDDKIITSWNGLMIGACARGYQIIGDARYLNAATRSAEFVLTRLYDEKQGRLKRRYRDEDAKVDAYLDDYMFFIHGLLDLYEASFEVHWLKRAMTLMETAIRLFWDEPKGGFFDTSGEDPSILVRLKEQYDGAEPSGNSAAVQNLLRLSSMTSRREWREYGEKTIRSLAALLDQAPTSMPLLLSCIRMLSGETKQILIAGEKGDKRVDQFLRHVRNSYFPHRIVMLVSKTSRPDLSSIHPFLGTLSTTDGNATAYVCTNNVCQLPTTDPDVFAQQLTGSSGPSAE